MLYKFCQRTHASYTEVYEEEIVDFAVLGSIQKVLCLEVPMDDALYVEPIAKQPLANCLRRDPIESRIRAVPDDGCMSPYPEEDATSVFHAARILHLNYTSMKGMSDRPG